MNTDTHDILINYMSLYIYGISTGIIISAGLFALFFCIKKIMLDKLINIGLTFFYGAIAFLCFAFFNTYSFTSHFPIATVAFPPWLLFICKLSVPVGLYMNFKMLTKAIPVISAETFTFWQRSKKYQYIVYSIYFITLIALAFFITEAKWVMIASFSLIILHCLLSVIVSIYTVQSKHIAMLHSVVVLILAVCFAILIATISLYDLTSLPNLWFMMTHIFISLLILICSFSLICYIVDVAKPQRTRSLFRIDSFEKNMYYGLKNNEFFIEYQPKLDLNTKVVYGLEALIRWRHPKKGLITPDQFIPLAEQTSVIDDICKFVIDTSIQDIKCLHAQNIHVSMAINFSVKNINQEIVYYLIQQLTLHKVTTSFYTVEITESLFLTMSPLQRQALQDLHAQNINLSLDDFGAGFSSLQHIDELQLNEIKLDRSIVEKISIDGTNSVVNNVIKLCQDLGINVVAEGVNSLAMRKELLSMGCSKAQGFGISRPQSIVDFIDWYNTIRNKDIKI